MSKIDELEGGLEVDPAVDGWLGLAGTKLWFSLPLKLIRHCYLGCPYQIYDHVTLPTDQIYPIALIAGFDGMRKLLYVGCNFPFSLLIGMG